jgi:hypothetical protein
MCSAPSAEISAFAVRIQQYAKTQSIGPARPSGVDRLYGELFEILIHPLRSSVYVGDDHLHCLPKRHVTRWAAAVFLLFGRVVAHHEINDIYDGNTPPLHDCF